MKRLCFAFLVLLLFPGCTSLPHVENELNVTEGTYVLRIGSGYKGEPEKLKYAVNAWVMEQGHTSYDLETRRVGNRVSYYVTIPGSTPVEDLPRIKHYHPGRTAALVAPIIGGVTFALTVILSVLLSSPRLY